MNEVVRTEINEPIERWEYRVYENKPEVIEHVYGDVYVQRRNIHQLIDGRYTCDLRAITEEQYNVFKQSMNDPNTIQSIETQQVIMSAQADTFNTIVRDMNTLMLAIADLYEKMITK